MARKMLKEEKDLRDFLKGGSRKYGIIMYDRTLSTKIAALVKAVREDCIIIYMDRRGPIEKALDGDTCPSCAAKDARLSEFTQAVGLMTTIKGSMVMRPDDPIGMAQEVAAYVSLLEKVAEAAINYRNNETRDNCEVLEGAISALDAAKEG